MKKLIVPVMLTVLSFPAFADIYTTSIEVHRPDAAGNDKIIYTMQNSTFPDEGSTTSLSNEVINKKVKHNEGFIYNSKIFRDKENPELSILYFDLQFTDKTQKNKEEDSSKTYFETSQKILVNDDYSKDLNFPPYTIKLKVNKE